MITIYRKPLGAGSKFFDLVDEWGTILNGAIGSMKYAKQWAEENGYYISKRPYTPANVAAEA